LNPQSIPERFEAVDIAPKVIAAYTLAMTAIQTAQPMTAAAFLTWEATQQERHTYFAGEVFAMAGGSDAHNTVALNLAVALRSRLEGSLCRVFMADMRLEVARDTHYTYPDVFVTCDPRDREQNAALMKRHPNFIAEVLSPSTAGYDRGLKFAGYRDIATVQEVLFIDPERRVVELYQRSAAAPDWVLHPLAVGQALSLQVAGSKPIRQEELFAGL
jgi:Uma2 family endonuclease